MNALGAAVIADFDGTLAQLDVPWQSLRESLSVHRIDDLWHEGDAQRWDVVTRAEVEAARVAAPAPFVMEALESVPAVAVLTSNDETAVETFLDRWPDLRSRVRLVVGRRTLGGPKTDFDVFSAGYASCARAVAPGAASTGPATVIAYLGDMSYELDYARRLGAQAFDVTDLEPPARGRGEG